MNLSILDAIRRICKRTERNIAVAGALVGSVAAMQKLFPTVEHFSTLKLCFYDGSWDGWECRREDGTPPLTPWRDFLRWYHGRPQSECYVMAVKTGSKMVRRVDIKSYDIFNGEREKAV